MPSGKTDAQLLEEFGGLVTKRERGDLEIGQAYEAQNVVFGPGRFSKRPGLTSIRTLTLSGSAKASSVWVASKRGDSMLYGTSADPLLSLSTTATLGRWEAADSGTDMDPVTNASRIGPYTDATWANIGQHVYFLPGNGRDALCRPMMAKREVYGGTLEKATGIGCVPPFTAPTVAYVDLTSPGMDQGLHKYVCIFESTDGTWSSASKPGSIDVTGATWRISYKLATPVETTPDRYYKAHFFMTPADSDTYYYIGEITGTIAYFNQPDTVIMAGERLDYPTNYLNNFNPPTCAAIFGPFNNRLWLAKPTNALWREGVDKAGAPWQNNLDWKTIDSTSTTAAPRGWTKTGTGTITRRTHPTDSDTSADQNIYWELRGDGSATPVTLATTTTIPYTSAPVLSGGNFGYFKVRMRATHSSGCGVLTLELTTGGGYNLSTTSTEWVTLVTAGGQWVYDNYSGTGGNTITVKLAQTPTSGRGYDVDFVEFFSSVQAVFTSSFLVSDPTGLGQFITPDSFLSIDEGDGDEITNAFEIGGRRFVTKHRATYLIQDDGGPAMNWTYSKIAQDVGASGFHAVGKTDEFVVICGRAGAHLFSGGTIGSSSRISDEIGPTWDNIHWEYGHKVWCQIDTEARRVYIGVPTGSSTTIDKLLVCDYSSGWASPFASPTGGRKWSIWTIAAASGAFLEMTDGTRLFVLGNEAGNGKIYKLDATNPSDDSSAISVIYTTAPIGKAPFLNLAESLLVDGHGDSSAVGETAALSLSLIKADDTSVTVPGTCTLYEPGVGKSKFFIHEISEDFSVKVANNTSDDSFTINQLELRTRQFRGGPGRPENPVGTP